MTIVTVFRSRLREGVDDDYREVAAQMSALVATMEGFVDQAFYVSLEGERVTIVRFTDVESQRAWSRHPAHLAAQERGRREFYAWYDISIGDETYARTFSMDRPLPAGASDGPDVRAGRPDDDGHDPPGKVIDERGGGAS